MKRTLFLLVTAVLFVGCASKRSDMGADSADSGRLTGTGSGTVAPEESSFARQACQAGVAEMEIAKMAARNTKNEAVRSLARKLVEDHAAAEKELNQLFIQKGLRADPKLAENLETSISRLSTLKGGEFDQAFKQQVIEDHEKAIALFEKQAQQGEDPDLKAFAQKHLPHLREHLEMARALPIGSDTDGPSSDASLDQVLQNPATRLNTPR